jgi:hypothetical protein
MIESSAETELERGIEAEYEEAEEEEEHEEEDEEEEADERSAITLMRVVRLYFVM